MIKENYQELARRTCANLVGSKLDMAHMILGMISEMNELNDAMISNDIVNIGEEIADQFWYIANYCTFQDLVFSDLLYFEPYDRVRDAEYFETLYDQYSKWADLIKKYVAYDKPIDPSMESVHMNIAVRILLGYCKAYDISVDNILESNIAKLKARYPDKFNSKDALNRDLDTERKILEQ